MTKKQDDLVTAIEGVSVSPTPNDAGAGASFDRGAKLMKEAIVELLRGGLEPTAAPETTTQKAEKYDDVKGVVEAVPEPEPESEPTPKVRKHRKLSSEE